MKPISHHVNRLRAAFGGSIRESKRAFISPDEDGTAVAYTDTGDQYAIYVVLEETRERVIAYYSPEIDLGLLTGNTAVRVQINDRGQYDIIGADRATLREQYRGSAFTRGLVSIRATLSSIATAIITALRFTAATELTIATGAVTRTQTYHTIDTEADASSDDLDTISGGVDGDVLVIRPADAARTVVVTQAGNIVTGTGTSITLDDTSTALWLTYDDTLSKWIVISGVLGAAPNASDVTYTPTTGSDWTDPDPADVAEALDDIAGRVTTLEGGGSGATTALDNLASVAINTSLVSDTDNTDDLGSASIKWRETFTNAVTLEERTAPGTPASGDLVVYAKSDGMYYKTDGGTEVGPLAAAGAGSVTVEKEGGSPSVSATVISFGDNLTVTDLGGGNALVDASGGAGSPTIVSDTQTRTLLASSTLGSAGRFDLTSISGSYEDLYIKLRVRSTGTGLDVMYLFFNNDTTTGNYHSQRGGGYNNGASNAELANPTAAYLASSTSVSGSFSWVEIFIPDYASTTFRKHAFVRNVVESAADTMGVFVFMLHWDSTSAITQITLQPDGYSTDNFDTGSICKLYGVSDIDQVTNVT